MSRLFCQALIPFAAILLMCGCAKRDFRIEFSLPEDVSANYTITYYASGRNGGFTVENVAVVTSGKGTIVCPAARPTIVFLSASGGLELPIYAERGQTIHISGPDRNPWSWTIGGNDLNTALSEWISANEPVLIGGNRTTLNDSIAAFVYRNPDSPISPLLLLTMFSRRNDESTFRRLWNNVAQNPQTAKISALVGRADIPGGNAPTPGKLITAAFRSLHNGVDTIRPANAKATLLFFWEDNRSDKRNAAIDSIRALSKEFPDSASRIIADIAFDADSISWKSPLAKDSLSKVARFWVPAGIADSRIIALRVERTPFFIVFSPDGNQKYRGSDPAEALSAFRQLMK